ncbi:LETM1 domain-containing protein ylh47 [Tieghemiomyces parasiticus]|uniref:LETM1 domain-containing protein ylh47 n=2 Tax=Tieghemiomyces parasiticus TaxID=78921 RepID=A0A9W8DX14_9FUNG|nr:LETM1 domain-containing protein ylh47 [Tieghemiomyces parasiticus]
MSALFRLSARALPPMRSPAVTQRLVSPLGMAQGSAWHRSSGVPILVVLPLRMTRPFGSTPLYRQQQPTPTAHKPKEASQPPEPTPSGPSGATAASKTGTNGQATLGKELEETVDQALATADIKPVVPASAAPVAKKPIMQRIKDELHHMWDGTKLLALETRISTKLLYRMAKGHTLSRREQRQLSRTSKDLLRLIPFSFFVIVPFMELLLPVALWIFPNMLPSTFETKKTQEDNRRKLLKVRMEVSKFLRETMAESAKARHADDQNVDHVVELFHKVRSSGDLATTENLLKVAQAFEEDFTLDNLSRPQLVSICRYMNLGVYGLDNMLRNRIRNQMKFIRADDRMIKSEGVDSLTIPELQSACSARGMRALGVSPARLRSELKQWLDLHLNHKVPMTILILMRAFAISNSDSATLSPDVLQATLSSLPDNLLSEAELKVSEAQGKATNKQKLAVLEQQEDLIEDEHEQEQRDEENRQKSDDKAKRPSATTESKDDKDKPKQA